MYMTLIIIILPIIAVALAIVFVLSSRGERISENNVWLYSAGFRAITKQGDIFLLAPREYNSDETTAVGRFFTRPGPNPTVIVLLFICTSIS